MSNREFWIVLEREEPTESLAQVHFSEWNGDTKFFKTIHVIEYSAYESLRTELEQAKGLLRECITRTSYHTEDCIFNEKDICECGADNFYERASKLLNEGE